MSTAEQAQDVAADLYMVVNKLTAEMQLIHAALTAAGVTGPSTLSERVKALSSAFNAASRERDNYIAQALVAHNALNNATVTTSGNLDERVAQIVEKYKALEAENKELRASLVCSYPSVPIATTAPKETTITVPAGGSVRIVVEKQ